MAKMGIKTQVNILHITIKRKVIFILPIALNRFVKGVVIAAQAVLTHSRDKASKAGSHFLYLGTISTSRGDSRTNITIEGKTTRQINKTDFERARDNSSLFSCNLAKAGKVTLITWSIKKRSCAPAHL